MAEAATMYAGELSETQAWSYALVDELPEVYDAREAIRRQAEFLLETRRQNIAETADIVEMSLPVDAVSTANQVFHASELYGYGSAEHVMLREGLVLDCQRLVAEWYRKKRPEYFPQTRHVFDADTEEFFSHGLSIRQMTENALAPMSDDPEEEARRINERVEDATPHILRQLGGVALGGGAVRTISECTDSAINDYASDMAARRRHRGYRGYVPEIEKLMIRDIKFDTATKDRFEEQVGLPGIYITHDVIQEALARRGVETDDMDKTKLHGSQLLVHDDLMEFVELLDGVAGEFWCTNVYMGEEVAQDFDKDYANFRREALARQESQKDLAETVTTFVLDLAADGVDRKKAPAMVEDFVKKLLLNLGKHDVAAAEQMFDAKTAEGLREVAYLESIGQEQLANELMLEVEQAAPGGGFCGAGSCGLESVKLSGESGRELAGKLGVEAGDKVVKDTVRKCRCGKSGIFYAYSKEKVKKYCDSCGSSEAKST